MSDRLYWTLPERSGPQPGFTERGAMRRRGGEGFGSLESSWVVFVCLLATSFYWWGRIDIGPLKAPICMLFVPAVAVLWLLDLVAPARAATARLTPGQVSLLKALGIPFACLLMAMLASVVLPSARGGGGARNLAPVLVEFLSYATLFFLMLQTIRSERGIARITGALVLGIGVLALHGLYRFFVTETLWRIGVGDVHTATNMGAFMFQAAIVLIAAKLVHDRRQSTFSSLGYAGLLACLVLALAFTYSRGAWLTTVAGLGVVVNYRRSVIVPVLAIAIVTVVLLPRPVIDRAISSLSWGANKSVVLYRDAEIRNTAHLRLRNWADAISDIADRPILGNGMGYYHSSSVESRTGESAPHNSIIRLWGEAGIVAVLSFGVFVGALVYLLRGSIGRARDETRWMLIGYLALMVTQGFYLILGDWIYQVYFWVFAGLAAASVKVLDVSRTKDCEG